MFLENDEVKDVHKKNAKKGDTKTDSNSKIDNHFISFINFKGVLYEMDGGKDFPVNHGKTSEQTFLNDTCQIAKEYMKRDPNCIEFGITVLSAK